MPMIQIEKLSKVFLQEKEKKEKAPVKVLNNVSMNIEKGEFVTFFGPNGCGKSTFLHLISGLHQPTAGKIGVNNKTVEEAKVGFVFQDYSGSIFPWRTVSGNVEFGLEVQGVPKEKRRKMAREFMGKLNLTEHSNKYPYQLSGGLKQLTAIARALVYDPDIFVLDEPFSALDYQTTRRMWLELLRVWKDLEKTTLFVSHFVDEAVFLADRVVVFSKSPARIMGEVLVDLGRPRKLEMLQSRKFFALRNRVLKLFEEGLK
ncbi:MAG: ABC transporter ATP-binding protein [Candidatus Aenigmarchaeota archaeon]|nr:ABC transporter ATP-binding protein [Candidatus Aenigmarchaeota archaeon]